MPTPAALKRRPESAEPHSPEHVVELQTELRELERQLQEKSAQIRTYEQHIRILEEALWGMRSSLLSVRSPAADMVAKRCELATMPATRKLCA
jgi:chromosome segregation ATPase